MIRYFELGEGKVKYFSLNDIDNTLRVSQARTAQWKAKTKILQIQLREFKAGLVMGNRFFVLPNDGWFIHWTVAEGVEQFYAKSKNEDRRKIFSLMDYSAGDPNFPLFFQLVNEPLPLNPLSSQ